MDNHSQNKCILECLKAGESLTPMDALRRFGSERLAARINDIRKGKVDGRKYDKDTGLITEKAKANGKTFARYRLMTPTVRMIQEIPAFKEPTAAQPQNTNLLF